MFESRTKKKVLLIVIAVLFLNAMYVLFTQTDNSSHTKEPVKILDIESTSKNSNAKAITIKEGSVLRVLTWSGAETYLPRSGHPQFAEIQYLYRFARENKAKIDIIKVAKFSDLIPMLLRGEGDVIAANMTMTSDRKKKVSFSLPIFAYPEFILLGKDAKQLKDVKDLNGRELVIQKGKSYEVTAKGLQKAYPDLKIRYIDSSITHEQLYDGLASGEYDLTIQDKNLIDAALDYRDDLKVSLQASNSHNIGWALSPHNKQLLVQLNDFIKTYKLNDKDQISKKITSQWKHIVDSNKVRFVLRNNLSSYYIWRGQLLGFHYELVKHFADQHNLRYEIIVAPDNVNLLDYLLDDKADIALGFLTPTQERIEKGIAFSRPYHYASELVIAHKSHPEIETINDLANNRFFLRESSSYWQTALGLQEQIPSITLLPVAETIETEQIIDQVGLHNYDTTIADSHIVDIELSFRKDIKSLISLGEPKAQSWAVHAGNDELLKKVDKFIDKNYKGLFYNVIYNKYFKNIKRLELHREDYVHQLESGVISPYDETIKKYAEEYDFDWRLLVSQMHQESRFNPKAKSMSGALGLFQLMPRTAKQLGIKNVQDPEQGIKAGVSYMDWVRQRMIVSGVTEPELLWFTLASYNAGTEHVRDAMRLAKQKGWDNHVWFGNVEKAMLLLAQPKYAAKARYGYVRGQEPVTYIREIKLRFESYKNILPEEESE